MAQAQIGTISHGTLRTQDLLRAFASELERIAGEVIEPCHGSGLVADAREWADRMDVVDTDGDYDISDIATAQQILLDISDALNERAPEGCYFGTLEGDGSDFGFWPLPEEEG